MLSRDSFYAPELDILRGVKRWLEAAIAAQTITEDSDDTASIASLPAAPIGACNAEAKLDRQSVRSSLSSESLFSSASASDYPGGIARE